MILNNLTFFAVVMAFLLVFAVLFAFVFSWAFLKVANFIDDIWYSMHYDQ